MMLKVIIKQVAQAHGVLNARQLKQRTELTYPQVARLWQGGNMESVNLRALEAIGKALGVPAKDLLEEGE